MGKISTGSKLLFIAFLVIPFSAGITIGHCYLDKHKDKNPCSRNDVMDEHFFDEKPSAPHLNQYEEPHKKLLLSGFKWLETAWHRIRRGKRWLKYLIPLVVVGLLFGLVMILHSAEKNSDSHHWSKDHHGHDD